MRTSRVFAQTVTYGVVYAYICEGTFFHGMDQTRPNTINVKESQKNNPQLLPNAQASLFVSFLNILQWPSVT